MDKNQFIRRLGMHRRRLLKNQIKTLRGQALAGNVRGAQKGLLKILQERRKR